VGQRLLGLLPYLAVVHFELDQDWNSGYCIVVAVVVVELGRDCYLSLCTMVVAAVVADMVDRPVGMVGIAVVVDIVVVDMALVVVVAAAAGRRIHSSIDSICL
jgi:uncharacterized membrane protein